MEQRQLVRVGIFIDGANLSEALHSSKLKINYASFLAKLRREFDIVSARYYSGVSSLPEHENVVELISVLSKHGYVPITKPVKVFPDGSVKANLDVELACDMVTMAPRLDKIILFSGDGDFTYAVSIVQRMGVYVSVCSTLSCLSAELRRQADEVLDLNKLIRKYNTQEK